MAPKDECIISTASIDNIPIPQTKSVKFLGVIVDQNLTWSDSGVNLVWNLGGGSWTLVKKFRFS